MLADRRITMGTQDARHWREFAQAVTKILQANGNEPGAAPVADLPRLRAEVVRLRFVCAARGAGERIERLQATIGTLETRLAHEREAEQLTARRGR